MTSETETLVLDLEKQRYVALIERDVAKLRALLADDLIYIHSTGNAHNKEEYLDAFERGEYVYQNFDRLDLEVRQLAPGAALISGFIIIKVKVKGEDKTLQSLFTNTWRQTERGWQMASWQSTPKAAGTQL
jgi:ketosteroid isomerase-like protein